MNTPEPPPKPSDGPAAWDLVLADIAERDRMGTAKYGQRLTTGDGRNTLVDVYQELLDAVVYTRKAIAEQEARDRALHDRVARWYEAGCPAPKGTISNTSYLRAGLPGWEG